MFSEILIDDLLSRINSYYIFKNIYFLISFFKKKNKKNNYIHYIIKTNNRIKIIIIFSNIYIYEIFFYEINVFLKNNIKIYNIVFNYYNTQPFLN